MPNSVFPYPGGKFYHAQWVVDHFPPHECYVEPFGGAATVLINKPQGDNEIFNDLDSDLVQFFEVLKNREDDLVDWLRTTKHSRELYEKWADAFYAGERPDGPVERAGRFFYLRYAQVGGKYENKSGFLSSPVKKRARRYSSAREKLAGFSRRFDTVTLENRDYREIIDQYDTPETLFYCDPPYVGSEHRYRHSEFSHTEFVRRLDDLAGHCVVSYATLPDALDADDWAIATRDGVTGMSVDGGASKQVTERLIMDFDPTTTPSFSGPDQTTLAEVGQ